MCVFGGVREGCLGVSGFIGSLECGQLSGRVNERDRVAGIVRQFGSHLSVIDPIKIKLNYEHGYVSLIYVDKIFYCRAIYFAF